MASLREENFDQIIINDLKAYTTIGVFPEEQHTRQQVIVNIRLFIDLQQPCQTDQLEDTLDYSSLTDELIEVIESSSCQLLECLADAVCNICLQAPRVQKAIVSIKKPEAIPAAESAEVRIARCSPRES